MLIKNIIKNYIQKILINSLLDKVDSWKIHSLEVVFNLIQDQVHSHRFYKEVVILMHSIMINKILSLLDPNLVIHLLVIFKVLSESQEKKYII